MAFVDACAKLHDQKIYELIDDGKGCVLPIPMMNIIN